MEFLVLLFFLIGRGFLYIFFHFVGLCPYLYKYFIRRGKEETFFAFNYRGCHVPILFLV